VLQPRAQVGRKDEAMAPFRRRDFGVGQAGGKDDPGSLESFAAVLRVHRGQACVGFGQACTQRARRGKSCTAVAPGEFPQRD
jgi:hypothetical protein